MPPTFFFPRRCHCSRNCSEPPTETQPEPEPEPEPAPPPARRAPSFYALFTFPIGVFLGVLLGSHTERVKRTMAPRYPLLWFV